MRSRIVCFAAAVAALSLSACRDESKDLLAPKASDKLFVYDPGGGNLRPVLPDPEEFVEITAGDYHTCARKNNGNVYCWGKVGGPNIPSAQTVIPPTLALQGASQISAGANHTCALIAAGAAYCWGAGDFGQLGQANGYYPPLGEGPVAGPGPAGSATLSFTSIAAGGNSTCGSSSSGVYCWGELGDIKNPYAWGTGSPWPIAKYNGFTSLTLGARHACGYIISIQEVDCWGADSFGQVGVDPAKAFYYPRTQMVMFAALNPFGGSINRVSAHGNITCVDKTNLTVQCVGDNEYGALGNGQSGAGTFTHVLQTVGGGMQLRGVSTGSSHACAMDTNGAAFCWGSGLHGKLGNGSSITLSTSPLAVTGGHQYRALATGLNHSCGIGTDNKIYCWGQVNYRQLGTRIVNAAGNEVTNGYSPNPVQTMDPVNY